MDCSELTRLRYEASFRALRSKGRDVLGGEATIAGLASVPWNRLFKTWGRSSADWNHLRRAVSAFLSVVLGDKYHPFRRTVLRSFNKAAEAPRVPHLTTNQFWRMVEASPEWAQPCFVTLVVTGMRVGEYLRCTKFNLAPQDFAVDVPGSKTGKSSAPIYVAPELWEWIARGIPCPAGYAPKDALGVAFDPRYKRLRRAWKAACRAEGVDLRLHDLRHCFGQWSVDAGVPEARVQTAMRHSTPAMTRRYTLTSHGREVATAIGSVLAPRRAS
jgi:integrase